MRKGAESLLRDLGTDYLDVYLLTAGECRTYLDEVLMPLCRVFPSESLFHEALSICDQRGLSWYDSLIVAAARQAGCETLWTEDLQDGARFGSLTIRNPFAGQ